MQGQNININTNQPLLQRAVKFDAVRIDAMMVFKVIGIVVLIIVLILAYKFWLAPKLKSLFQTNINVPDQPYQPNGGGVSGDFVQNKLPSIVSNLNAALVSSCYTTCPERCERFRQVNNLTDNEIIAVANSYKNTYRTTLLVDCSKITRDGCTSLFGYGDAQHEKLIANLKRLNL